MADETPESKEDMQTFLSLLSNSSNAQSQASLQEKSGNIGGAKVAGIVARPEPK